MGQFTYVFEELPLLVEGGVEAGLLNGEAVIDYDADGTWTATSIKVDGCDAGRPKSVEITQQFDGALFYCIHDRLENGVFADHIADEIQKDLECARDDHSDYLYEQARDRRMEERL